jgi:hypothetical protein
VGINATFVEAARHLLLEARTAPSLLSVLSVVLATIRYRKEINAPQYRVPSPHRHRSLLRPLTKIQLTKLHGLR